MSLLVELDSNESDGGISDITLNTSTDSNNPRKNKKRKYSSQNKRRKRTLARAAKVYEARMKKGSEVMEQYEIDGLDTEYTDIKELYDDLFAFRAEHENDRYWVRKQLSKKSDNKDKIVTLTLKCSKHGKSPILPISEMAAGYRHDMVSICINQYIYISLLSTSI